MTEPKKCPKCGAEFIHTRETCLERQLAQSNAKIERLRETIREFCAAILAMNEANDVFRNASSSDAEWASMCDNWKKCSVRMTLARQNLSAAAEANAKGVKP